MIGYLRGVARGAKLLDVNGVGYHVHCPTPLVEGDEVELWIHTQVRDDAIVLFGFTEGDDKQVFEALTKVPGIGPSHALNLLANLGRGTIIDSVSRKDTKTLSSVKGIGPSAAEKIVTFVKLPDLPSTDPKRYELTCALIGLGYDRTLAATAVETAYEQADNIATDAELLSIAITIAGRTR